MKDSVLLKWLLCFFIVAFCSGTLSLTTSVSQEKKAIATPKDRAVKKQQTEAVSANQPAIVIEAKEYDAGEVYEGDEVIHSFIVKNKGKGELHINKVKPG
jgi:hypothetical protein